MAKTSSEVSGPKELIIDTDPGTDDTAAIFFALASPEVSVEALTTVYGNGTLEQCTRNACFLVETANRQTIPVYRGAGKPMIRDPHVAYHIHGEDALGGAAIETPGVKVQDQHAVDVIVDTIMANPGEITLVALGPLTNVALALSVEPRLAQALKELVLMGGAIFTRGNISEVATANLWNDPEAAAIVYQSGAPLVQAGNDVCLQVTISDEQIERIRSADLPTTRLLARVTEQRMKGYHEQGWLLQGGIQYNDLLAVAYVVDPSLFKAQDYYVRISTHDELTRGQTVADGSRIRKMAPNTKVLMQVDAERLTELFVERITSYSVSH